MRGVISNCFALSPVESYASFRGSSSSRARFTPMQRATQEEKLRLAKRQFCHGKTSGLLDEQRLAQLVAADERLNGPEPRKKVLDFTILIDPLRWTQGLCTYDLQRCGIGNPIAMKTFRFFAVEQRTNNPAGPQ